MPADPDRPAPDTAPLTSDAPAPDAAPDRPGLRGLVARRWPTLLALVLVAPGLADRPTPETVEALASAMLLLPLWYLVITATGRRSWTWPVLVVGIAAFVLLRMQERVEPAVVLLATALVAVLWGAVRGGLGRPSFLLQVSGLVAYGGPCSGGPGPRSRGGPVRRRRGLVRARPLGPRPRARRRRSVAIRRGVVRRGRRPDRRAARRRAARALTRRSARKRRTGPATATGERCPAPSGRGCEAAAFDLTRPSAPGPAASHPR